MMLSSLSRVLVLLTCLLSICFGEGLYESAKRQGLKIHTCGNSYTASTFSAGMEELIEARGYSWGKYKTAGVAGATLTTVIALDGEDLRAQLPTESWDLLVLQSYYSDLEKEKESALKIVEMGRKHNPDIRVLMYTIWPKYEERYEPRLGRTEAWNEAIRDAIVEKYPEQFVQVIPVSLIYRELYEMIDAGQVPNMRSHSLLFSDGGHPGKYGAYPIMMAAAAMMYNESPLGYPNVSTHHSTIEEETAAVFQQVVWDVLMTYDGARMSVDPIISTRRLQTAVDGLSCDIPLEAMNVSGSQTWSLATDSGPLPAGVQLDPAGRLHGTPQQAGEYPVTLQMQDGGTTSTRAYTWRVDPNVPPSIRSTDLGSVPHAEYVSLKLESEGGVGRLAWELVEGELPPGMLVAPAGFITGVPAKSGSYKAVVQVTDSHPAGAKSATSSITMTVAEPVPGTIMVRQYDQTVDPVYDGFFDEPYWDFSQARSLEKVVAGSPTATVQWDIFWKKDKNNKKNVNLFIGAKIRDGALGKTPGDALHFFFDGNNNDEVIYNYDDSHFRITRDGNNGGERLVAGYTSFFMLQLGIREVEGGWDVEARFGSGALSGRGIVAAWPEWYVSGFDIAVEQGSGTEIHRAVWQGDEYNDTETDAYGAIVFAPESSQPLPVRRLINGDFADDQMINPNWIEPADMPKHAWLTTTQRGYYAAWHIRPGKGAFQGDVKGRTVDHRGDEIKSGYLLAQIIDTPSPGRYRLSFAYTTPKVGFRVGVWGGDFTERFKLESPAIADMPSVAKQPKAAQYLPVQQLPAHKDEQWRDAAFEFDIPDNLDGECVLVFWADEQGNLDSGIRSVRLEVLP
jgi:hypothetical protein